MLFPSSLSHHLEAQSKAVQAAALKEPCRSGAAACPVALLGKGWGSACGWPSVPAPALPKSVGSSRTAASECSVPPSMASHSRGYLCERRHQTGLASTLCAARHRNCKWKRTCQQGDFIWEVRLSSPLPFLFWMHFEQLSVQVFVIIQALLLQSFVFWECCSLP